MYAKSWLLNLEAMILNKWQPVNLLVAILGKFWLLNLEARNAPPMPVKFRRAFRAGKSAGLEILGLRPRAKTVG
jgi:hypothetical protein